ncbi:MULTISPECIES: nicotinamide riboside transporter PnuC [unclassified Gilliamella]|uniref:nicotinamide riboside transporter PnuC n=1 Tax=unclassified Gilliamella TaxID=2685620 RepID=UPI00080ECC96|nr:MULTISPECIES: nicotinamide riboside transporter PnuC [Gilliamella]MCX8584574.1 nicotinamide mononucleotide transporter [Gilliamella sp. B3372]MCX8584956.1 nicotinamide mononucleotide transporter [Gilliamella sp. B3562]MCX8593713.1 nicotinamide mononucleotide transporter [Gilliamella sp. B3367]MCX8596025.1 nicotinamide mononucleotide transporter [Gilliamella sp. B3493]MCX8598223.1 nicotinamide mononucleotide transporter [Gilliamella sp. B3486]
MNNLRDVIIAIGRNKFYPLFCIICVTLAFLYTDPFNNFNLRYAVSYAGAFLGLLCVILLAKRKNLGNVLGMLAVVAECCANFLGGNIGAGLPTFYYFGSHIYGLFTWQKNLDQNKNVKVRSLNESAFLYALIFLIVAAFFNIYLTNEIGASNTSYQLITNCFIFGLGVVAQLLLMMRYAFNWYLWVLLNVLVIGLNIYTDNIVIATQYLIYLFNALYGISEWKLSEEKAKENKL